MNRLVIRNDEELFAATERAQQIMGFTEGSAEEREMDEIADAVDQYAASLLIQSRAANDDIPPPAFY